MTYKFLTSIIALGAFMTFEATLYAMSQGDHSWSDNISASYPSTTYETQNEYMTYVKFKSDATLLKVAQNLDASRTGSVSSGSYAWVKLDGLSNFTPKEVSRINKHLSEGTSLHSKGNGSYAVEFDLASKDSLESRLKEASEVIKSKGGPRALQGLDLKDTTVSALTVAIRKKA